MSTNEIAVLEATLAVRRVAQCLADYDLPALVLAAKCSEDRELLRSAIGLWTLGRVMKEEAGR